MSHQPTLNVHDFRAKWRHNARRERASAHEHFGDLCRLIGFPTPSEADPVGSFYAFERPVRKLDGSRGFADVWYKDRFAWEYKGRGANLQKAYEQVLLYREDLGNPPLLVVSDMDRTEVHTNFEGTEKKVYPFSLDDLLEPHGLDVLQWTLTDPKALKPGRTVDQVTEAAAERFAGLAVSMERRGVAPRRAAHFLVQVLFCLFSEDVGLLPRGLFSKLLTYCAAYPDSFPAKAEELFRAMETGGEVAYERIARFNGGLFANVDVVPLEREELAELVRSAELHWGSVEPAIFGTLFERSLDPSQRGRLGAHYTGRADIERVVDPVLMEPLRRRWAEVKAHADELKERWRAAPNRSEEAKRKAAFRRALTDFQQELVDLTVLDPACGSGNFLYVALACLHDFELDVSKYGADNGLPYMLPLIEPRQFFGLEVNPYARELAQVVVWIGHLQWMQAHGFPHKIDPVVDSTDTIEIRDALLAQTNDGRAMEAAWPRADVIVGNPPFLGAKKFRRAWDDDYVEDLFGVYRGRVPGMSDLSCYFFEKARSEIEHGRAKRAGLLATNSIRGGASRHVLDRIKRSGDIFMAWDDEPWILEGASVRISIVGFDDGSETSRVLDGSPVPAINPDLTALTDLSIARPLPENRGVGFVGDVKAGKFDVSGDLARCWLALPPNPNGRPNADVVRPWVNSLDVLRRPRDTWIVDFGIDMPESEAALYEAPFEHARRHVKPARDMVKRARYRENWWLHAEPVGGMRRAVAPLPRYVVTPTVAKHRVFAWLSGNVLADHQLVAFAREDDYFFGVLHSRAHEIWSLRLGTSLEDRPRYTPTTCFETFPFPRPSDVQRQVIAAAAAELDRVRSSWLSPHGAPADLLRTRSLTNLYNARPTWLTNLHDALDRAVWSAYGWTDPDPSASEEDAILARLLALNLERAGVTGRSLAPSEDRVATPRRLPEAAATPPNERAEEPAAEWLDALAASEGVLDGPGAVGG